jgi:hypothetical protein
MVDGCNMRKWLFFLAALAIVSVISGSVMLADDFGVIAVGTPHRPIYVAMNIISVIAGVFTCYVVFRFDELTDQISRRFLDV